MKKSEIKRMYQHWTEKKKGTLANNRGASEIVAVVVMIIIVLVVAVIVFLPQITSYISSTVMPGLATETGKLFNYGG